MKPKWDAVLTMTLVVCALITTSLVVHHEFLARSASSAQSAAQKPVFVKNWNAHLGQGVMLGPSNAPVQLMEFADFECPFCGSFHQTLKGLPEKYPAQVSLTYVHFPLQGHRFALPAARVAECAGEQGRFEAMYDRLFEQQEAFGLKPWSEFAMEAGVPDGGAFETCTKRTEPIPLVVEGEQLGKDLDVQATPTVIINGWKLVHPPSEPELEAMVKLILAGKEPVPGASKS